MRWLSLSPALLLTALVQIISAQGHSNSSALPVLPGCAISCLSKSLVHSTCAPTNQTCICRDAKLQEEVTVCVVSSCKIKDALFTKNVTSTSCKAPINDRRELLNVVTVTLGIASGVIVALRFITRLFVVKGELGLDDWFILVTLILGIPNTALIVNGLTANGLGLDVWTLSSESITAFTKYFFVIEVTYFALVTLIKMSLLFFYLRIFPAPAVRRILWATVTFNVLFGVVFVIVAIFQCQPVDYFWTGWDGEHAGKCLDINAIGWANAAISIAVDLWMLAVPLSQLKKLKLHWKKKIGVGIMFSVGTFITVVSILRLQSLVTFSNSLNPTWDNWEVTKWSVIEINVGIICACLPSLRLLLVRIFPVVGGSTNGYYANGGKGGPSHGRYYGGDSRGGVSLGSVPRAAAGGEELAKMEPRARSSSPNGKTRKHGASFSSLPAGRDRGVSNVLGAGGGRPESTTTTAGSSSTLDSVGDGRRHNHQRGASGAGISYQRSYMVSYDNAKMDQDEESLVQMHVVESVRKQGRSRDKYKDADTIGSNYIVPGR